ncbi:MAG: acyltransferase family protein [Candidatus Izemoplasmataceae bacterium]
MKKYYFGLDVLRGLGIFFVIVLHSAFYFFDGVYDIDLNNPSLVVTLIGFLLMFAGLFAMISGTVHSLSYEKKRETLSKKALLKYMVMTGVVLLVVAYLYFIFTGPGLINFSDRSMDESIFVALFNQGTFVLPSIERLFYVDSLVMLALNVMLLGVVWYALDRFKTQKNFKYIVLLVATLFMIVSYIRIPLYNVYLNAADNNNYFVMILLNYFVNKNNPIFPFFAFALFGMFIGVLLKEGNYKSLKRHLLTVGLIYLVVGITGYILAPETMLERAIDPTWYFIMVMQIGLFLMLTLAFLRIYDFAKVKKANKVSKFISRFGVAGLSAFFIESTVSVIIFRSLNLFTTVRFGMFEAIIYGLVLALLWGFFFIWWEKKNYIYGVEHFMTTFLKRFGPSTKNEKLKGNTDV